MNLTPKAGAELARTIVGRLRDPELAADLDDSGIEIGMAPAFPALPPVRDALYGSPIHLVAQDVHYEPDGAFTGAVSAAMLAACGCSMVLVGHSERRAIFGDSDATVRRKAEAVLAAGMTPLLCVGETAAQRDAGSAAEAIGAQLDAVLDAPPEPRRAEFVVAYEPVWAIGSGRPATPDIAQEMHAAIRRELEERWGAETASRVRVLYGGSVKGDNAADLLGGADVDGLLVGGASLEADSFIDICGAAAEPPPQTEED